jgi:Flp pilus assembly protein TadB
VAVARAAGIDRLVGPSLTTDLRVLDQSIDTHLARRVAMAAAGAATGPVIAAAFWTAGLPAPLWWSGWTSLGLAIVGLVAPGVSARTEPAKRRAAFRHALGAFLDVVAVSLAAGSGVEGALATAATSGDGWAFAELRHALFTARMAGDPPWVGLARLGGELGVVELSELAATVALAGDSGAKVRASIQAKARSMRARALADAEAAAQAATERMSLPVVVLLVGFIVFIGYPAVVRVVTGI